MPGDTIAEAAASAGVAGKTIAVRARAYTTTLRQSDGETAGLLGDSLQSRRAGIAVEGLATAADPVGMGML